jgi:hypothetical protein
MTIFSQDAGWTSPGRPGNRAGRSPAFESVQIGAYLHSAQDLYRVET